MGLRCTPEEMAKMTGEAVAKPRRPNKYNAKPTQYKGVVYASLAEAKRAEQLDLMKRLQVVKWWLRQVPIDIGEPGVDKPYRVDFLVCHVGVDLSESICAEDVKGVATASFRRHVKQWRKRGPFPLHVITKGKTEVIPRGTDA